MDVSLIIIIHNTSAFITNLLASLKKINCHQIFLLNGMTNVAALKLIENYKQTKNNVTILKSGRLLRHPVAVNILLAEVKSKYVFIMDSDIFTEEENLIKIYQFIDHNKKIGAVQGLLIYPQNNRIQSTGHIYHEWGDYYGYYNNFIHNLEAPLKRQSISAGFAMYPTDLVLKIGGFDEFYSFSMDGVELSTRIHCHGYDVYCLPTVKGYHFHSLFRKTLNNPGQGEEGRFWATYGRMIKNDLTSEILSNSLFRNFSDYLIIDCSTVKNLPSFLDELGLGNKRAELKVTDLVEEKIILPNVVPYSLLRSRYKILWICTNFTQIAENQLLFMEAERQNDYIIDMNANVIPLFMLLKYQTRISI